MTEGDTVLSSGEVRSSDMIRPLQDGICEDRKDL